MTLRKKVLDLTFARSQYIQISNPQSSKGNSRRCSLSQTLYAFTTHNRRDHTVNSNIFQEPYKSFFGKQPNIQKSYFPILFHPVFLFFVFCFLHIWWSNWQSFILYHPICRNFLHNFLSYKKKYKIFSQHYWKPFPLFPNNIFLITTGVIFLCTTIHSNDS